MGFFGHDDSDQRRAYEQFQNTPPEHEAKFSHELIAGAASFAAMRAYEQHQDANGKPQSFELAKEIIAGFAGAEVDKLIETKGLNAIDAARAKHEAKEQAAQALAQSQQYGDVQYQRREFNGGGYEGGYGGGYGGGQGGYGGPPQGNWGGPPQENWGGPPQENWGGPGGQGYGPPGGPGGYGGGPGYGPPGGGYGGGPGGPGGWEGEREGHHHHHHEERREW
ncbi:hypothetical protein EHS25_009983 [Saitozyma podzolica]|uniref:Uncharacterized protein n=1 Tax=Saitozyma podzolica TaxID=1890683 RepID=A0A427YI99_9TREE|nr:hypothetical protein EHS25_009983 [Saitozyma podzolica]